MQMLVYTWFKHNVLLTISHGKKNITKNCCRESSIHIHQYTFIECTGKFTVAFIRAKARNTPNLQRSRMNTYMWHIKQQSTTTEMKEIICSYVEECQSNAESSKILEKTYTIP